MQGERAIDAVWMVAVLPRPRRATESFSRAMWVLMFRALAGSIDESNGRLAASSMVMIVS
jgi:hypothetical protein